MSTDKEACDWVVEVHKDHTSIESKYYTVASDLNNEDAERIVKCVKSHAKMLAVFRRILGYSRGIAERIKSPGNALESPAFWLGAIESAVSAEIEEAEGER